MPLNALRIDVGTLELGMGVWGRVRGREGVEWPIAIIFGRVVDPWAFLWLEKIRPPPPRMYNVQHRHRQLVTIKLMRGHVPQRSSGFQSLVSVRS